MLLWSFLLISVSVSQLTDDTVEVMLAVQQHFHCDCVYVLDDQHDGK